MKYTRCLFGGNLKRNEQQAYRTCRALLVFAPRYGEDLFEEACEKAFSYTSRPSYKTVKQIIVTLDEEIEQDPDRYAYLRGNEYYESLGIGE